MAEDSEKEPVEAAGSPARAKGQYPDLLSEAEIDSPDQKTLVLLFVVFALTVCSWGAARFACNMHPPESRAAPKLTTDKLITSAKDGAIEFVQRWRSGDYAGAAEVAIGEVKAEMEKAAAECQKTANECARKREAEAGRLTTAVVLRQDGFAAEAKVTTELKGKTDRYVLVLQRDGMLWKASSKTAAP